MARRKIPREPTIKELSLERIKRQKELGEFGRRTPTLFNFNFDDVIKNQVYISLYGMMAESEKNTKQISYDTGNDTSVSVDGVDRGAQTFTVGSSDLYVYEVEWQGVSSSNTKVEIRATTSDEPNGVILESKSITSSTGWHVFTFGSPLRLLANTKYALVAYGQSAASETLYVDGSSPTYTGGSVFTSTDSGSTWTEDTAKDAMFRIHGRTANPYILFPASGVTSAIASTSHAVTSEAVDDIMMEIDFDFEVQHTIAVKGQALLEITSSGGYDVITLYKYDGTTETQLATATTNSSGLVVLNIDTLTTIAKGDKIRLTYQNKASAIESYTPSINHGGSDLILHLPVKLIGDR